MLVGYTGGFAVAAAVGGARSTCAVDLAPKAVAACRRNEALNGLAAGEHFVADVWDFLRASRRMVDIVVLDPPSMAPSARARGKALKAYEELNMGALRLVRPGGTCRIWQGIGI